MTESTWNIEPTKSTATEPAIASTFSRVTKYTAVRVAVLFFTVVVTVFLTIIIANLGGFVDEIIKAQIDTGLANAVAGGWLRDAPAAEKVEIIEQTRQAMWEANGLNTPFLVRCFRWLGQGLTLDWGQSRSAQILVRGRLSADARDLILDSLPRTLLLFGTANLLLFFTSVFLALVLTRKYGSWLDKAVIVLSPMGAVPAWAWGIILNVFFMRVLGILSTGGTLDAWPSEFKLAFIPVVLKHMVLPFLAIFIGGFFQSIYAWRALFLLYAHDDHVELATAKGLPTRQIERSYILRPGLPAVLTGFALMLVVLWQEVIALEKFFNVSGIGRLFYAAIRGFDMPVVLGLVVTFAYILAITVFVLDIVYAWIDPRVRVGTESQTVKPATRRKRLRFSLRSAQKPPFIRHQVSRSHTNLALSLPAKKQSLLTRIVAPLRDGVRHLSSAIIEIADYPSAVIGLIIIIAFICTSIATVIIIPYNEAISLWRGDDSIWYRNPLKAQPEWVNLFRKNDLPKTIALDSRYQTGKQNGAARKRITPVSEEMVEIAMVFSFDYPYKAFPQDMIVRIDAQYVDKKPLVTLTWRTPDGREIDLGTSSISSYHAYYLSMDSRLERQMSGMHPQEVLFADPTAQGLTALKGTYELEVSGFVFEEDANIDAELVLYGQVHGLAGTDHRRRDMMVGLLWGMPVALAFGLLAAFGTSVSTILIAAAGVWHGGWVDSLVQRITEINLILPFLPVSIMIYILYSKSFWAILGVTVLLSIFGVGIKSYRAIFLQLKSEPYIEAAQAYGANGKRIIFRYLVPRVGAIMIPQLVILIPAYVFLEATLAFLQVSDPILPTWGKLIVEALSHSVYAGDYHLVLEPAFLLVITGVAFAMVGMALERIFDPRLREM